MPKEEQILLHIVAQNKTIFQELQKITNYPHLKFIAFAPQFNLFQKIVNKFSFWLRAILGEMLKCFLNDLEKECTD